MPSGAMSSNGRLVRATRTKAPPPTRPMFVGETSPARWEADRDDVVDSRSCRGRGNFRHDDELSRSRSFGEDAPDRWEAAEPVGVVKDHRRRRTRRHDDAPRPRRRAERVGIVKLEARRGISRREDEVSESRSAGENAPCRQQVGRGGAVRGHQREERSRHNDQASRSPSRWDGGGSVREDDDLSPSISAAEDAPRTSDSGSGVAVTIRLRRDSGRRNEESSRMRSSGEDALGRREDAWTRSAKLPPRRESSRHDDHEDSRPRRGGVENAPHRQEEDSERVDRRRRDEHEDFRPRRSVGESAPHRQEENSERVDRRRRDDHEDSRPRRSVVESAPHRQQSYSERDDRRRRDVHENSRPRRSVGERVPHTREGSSERVDRWRRKNSNALEMMLGMLEAKSSGALQAEPSARESVGERTPGKPEERQVGDQAAVCTCGTSLLPKARFCGTCGKRTRSVGSTTPATSSQAKPLEDDLDGSPIQSAARALVQAKPPAHVNGLGVVPALSAARALVKVKPFPAIVFGESCLGRPQPGSLPEQAQPSPPVVIQPNAVAKTFCDGRFELGKKIGGRCFLQRLPRNRPQHRPRGGDEGGEGDRSASAGVL